MTDFDDEVFALPVDEPLPDHQPVPPAHPNRREALAAAVARIAAEPNSAWRATLDRLVSKDRSVVIVGETGFHDDAPRLLGQLGVPVRVLSGAAVDDDGLSGAHAVVLQCIGPSGAPTEAARNALRSGVEAGAVLLSTCRALAWTSSAFPELLGIGERADRETPVRVRRRPAGVGSESSDGIDGEVTWVIDGGAPEPIVRSPSAVLERTSADPVEGWSSGATPLHVAFPFGAGRVHHLTVHLWPTWTGEDRGDPWGKGDAGDEPTPEEVASVGEWIGTVVRLLAGTD